MDSVITILIIVLSLGLCIFWVIQDRKRYPNKFRGLCRYCNEKHGRSEWSPMYVKVVN